MFLFSQITKSEVFFEIYFDFKRRFFLHYLDHNEFSKISLPFITIVIQRMEKAHVSKTGHWSFFRGVQVPLCVSRRLLYKYPDNTADPTRIIWVVSLEV